MFHTCIRCYADLGRNETIETFPVGRRLAFDAAKGRLWVVCRKCERWNLTPLEERWEAIEDCQRLFSGTKLRVSTDNIGLARVGDGLDLVRIGSPLLPELAAWRYGDQFGRRWRIYWLTAALGAVASAGMMSLLKAGGVTGGVMVVSPLLAPWLFGPDTWRRKLTRITLRVPHHDVPVVMRTKQIQRATITSRGADWQLSFVYSLSGLRREAPEFTADLRGDDALRAAARILPAVNATGAGKGQVRAAASLLEETPDAQRLFMRFAPREERSREGRVPLSAAIPETIGSLPPAVRLALEMAANEENERRAMEGELAHLELEWRDAEEIAQIADDDATAAVSNQLDAMKGKESPR